MESIQQNNSSEEEYGMKKIIFAAFCASILPLFAESLYFDGKTDKNPVLYQVGEPMVFTIALRDQDAENEIAKGHRITWTRLGDDGRTEKGNAVSDQPLIITTKSEKPGFVWIKVNILDENGNPRKGIYENFTGGAGAEVNKLQADSLPDDFNTFWDAEIQKLHSTPYTKKITEIASRDPAVKVLKFELSTFPGDRPATGYILYPVDAAKKSLPMLVNFTGYGFHKTNIPYSAGKKQLVVEVTRQGEEPDREPEYYKNLQTVEMKGYCFRNNNDKHKNDFYGMYMRGQRAMQYAESLDLWNGKDITTSGGSMGAAQSIAAAALNPKVTRCTAFIPWVADLAGKAKFKRLGGWAPEYTETLRYFDTANLASRVKCPAEITIGLGDYICPPSGQMILFRNLGGKKTLKIRQNMGHGRCLQPNPYEVIFNEEIR